MTATSPIAERRVLILAPTGRDAELARTMLAEAALRSAICFDLVALVREIEVGAGALLISEEAFGSDVELQFLRDRLLRQPPWSDLPILLIAHQGADSAPARKAVRLLGNVTLLERPVRMASLVTALQTALRARLRQYEAREHLQELDDVAARLADSEARLQALFANAGAGIAELTATGEFTLANEALCAFLGLPRDKVVGTPLVDRLHLEDRADIDAAFADVVAGRRASFIGERRFQQPAGQVVWGKISLTATGRGGNGPVRGVAVIEDVTERKQAEDDLREADRRKDEFLATLAHELRNPLAPIRNSLHIFRMSGVQNPAVGRVADMIERQVQHMVRIVDDLMEIARISRGKIELRRERVELAGLLRNAVDTSLPLIESGRHRLRVEVPDAPIRIEADPVRMAQVFANLLNNSAKYTPPGGEIVLRATVEDGMASICVKDNGDGIPPAMLERVFNMFTQLNKEQRSHGGLGIGLTLARTLVRMHGGTIEARSEGTGQGCEFVVRLPLAQEAAQGESIESRASAAAPGELRRVLVVDDNQDAADSLGMLLRLLGAETMVVHDGPSALEALREFRPEVVLLDLGMPGMSGLEVARRIREDPDFRGLTIAALTGWGQREDRRRSREAGFDYHLVKPADLGALRSILTPQPEKATRH